MIIIAYVPALHRSYIEFFKKHSGKTTHLYLLADDVIADFPKTAREIRSINALTMRPLLAAGNYFKHIEIADKKKLNQLSQQEDLEILFPRELVSKEIAKKYFSGHRVTVEPFFLRYDETTVSQVRKEVPYDGEISEEEFDRHVIKRLEEEKENCSDFFLQLAAAIVAKGKIVAIGHNQRTPTAQEMWTVGDPRNFMEYGSDTHQRTTLHAEQTVIAACARDGIATNGTALYVTTFPCPDCSQLIAACGFKTLYFKDGYSELSASEVLINFGVRIVRVT